MNKTLTMFLSVCTGNLKWPQLGSTMTLNLKEALEAISNFIFSGPIIQVQFKKVAKGPVFQRNLNHY